MLQVLLKLRKKHQWDVNYLALHVVQVIVTDSVLTPAEVVVIGLVLVIAMADANLLVLADARMEVCK